MGKGKKPVTRSETLRKNKKNEPSKIIGRARKTNKDSYKAPRKKFYKSRKKIDPKKAIRLL